jgi:hypothetical protein
VRPASKGNRRNAGSYVSPAYDEPGGGLLVENLFGTSAWCWQKGHPGARSLAEQVDAEWI